MPSSTCYLLAILIITALSGAIFNYLRFTVGGERDFFAWTGVVITVTMGILIAVAAIVVITHCIATALCLS